MLFTLISRQPYFSGIWASGNRRAQPGKATMARLLQCHGCILAWLVLQLTVAISLGMSPGGSGSGSLRHGRSLVFDGDEPLALVDLPRLPQGLAYPSGIFAYGLQFLQQIGQHRDGNHMPYRMAATMGGGNTCLVGLQWHGWVRDGLCYYYGCAPICWPAQSREALSGL